MRILKGDLVRFNISEDDVIYRATTEEYVLNETRVVELDGYSGEVNVKYLDKVPPQGAADEGPGF